MPSAAAASPADKDEALPIELDTLSPAVVPRQGAVQVTGSVRNASDETWTNVNLYAFSSDRPITEPTELAEAVRTDPTAAVGARVLAPGSFDTVGDLEPGDSAGFTLRVPRSALDIPLGRPGVYWFGVHALGTNDSGRDGVADGRARTFLSQVGPGSPQLPVSLVLPLRRPVVHDDDGSIDLVAGWARQLEPGGRLRALMEFASAGPDRALTWLVDPAVLAAAERLAQGNPPRSMAPTQPEPGATPEDGASPGDSTGDAADEGAGGSPGPGGSEGSGQGSDGGAGDGSGGSAGGSSSPLEQRASEVADVWVKRAREQLRERQVLVLPYADLDVAAALVHEPSAYARAVSYSAAELDRNGIGAAPVFAPPEGLADAETLSDLAQGTTALLAQRAVEDGDRPGPPVREIAGREVVLVDTAATGGGPGPDPRLSALQVRQRLLAETALRSAGGDDSPMAAVLPATWVPEDGRTFFLGLDEAPWIRLATLDAATAGQAAATGPEALDYPESADQALIGRRNFAAVRGLTDAGALLDQVLSRNDAVGDVVAQEALAPASYNARRHRLAWRRVNQRSHAWIDDQLGRIRVEAPPSVTLSSEQGKFAASLVNELGQPVTVRIEARTDSPVEVRAPDSVQLAPGERTSVLLTARTRRIGLHDVELVVTAPNGVALGSRADLPIRSAQVSWIIWVVIAAGGTILFGAIAVRLTRRIRSAREARRDAPAPEGAA